jgi:hypothetical protein
MAGTSGEPGLPPWWDRIPDDASELEPDRRAWLAEQRALRRRALLRRLLLTRHWEHFGLSGPLALACLAFTIAVAALVVAVVPPSTPHRPTAAPLAAVPTADVTASAPPTVERPGGSVIGRLLPAVPLDGDVRAVRTSELRPAVLALVPSGCAGCAAVVGAIYRESREFRLDLWLVGPAGSAGLLTHLDEAGARGGARWAVDAAGRLAAALVPRGLTLVTVRADGVIADLGRELPRDPTALPALEPLLTRLAMPNR